LCAAGVGSDDEEDHFHKACSATYIQHCAAAAGCCSLPP